MIRANYSNPPAHGARVVSVIFSNPALFEEWKAELKGRCFRLQLQQQRICDRLNCCGLACILFFGFFSLLLFSVALASGMSGRIIKMRKVLYDALVSLNTPGDWTHITSQIGMFSFTGLTPAQCKVLSQDASKHSPSRRARIAHMMRTWR